MLINVKYTEAKRYKCRQSFINVYWKRSQISIPTTYRVVDEYVWPGAEPSFAAAHVLGRESDRVDAGFGNAENAAVDVHGALRGVDEATVVCH